MSSPAVCCLTPVKKHYRLIDELQPSSGKVVGASSSAAHLARIRDNQRRSRARRKEYLHDLEEKFRTYKERGIEASAEMQQAARRVLEENQRLRMALKARGISDEEIDSIAAEVSSTSPVPVSPPSAAVADLGNMLGGSGNYQDPETEDRYTASLTAEGSYGVRDDLPYGQAGPSSTGNLAPGAAPSISRHSSQYSSTSEAAMAHSDAYAPSAHSISMQANYSGTSFGSAYQGLAEQPTQQIQYQQGYPTYHANTALDNATLGRPDMGALDPLRAGAGPDDGGEAGVQAPRYLTVDSNLSRDARGGSPGEASMSELLSADMQAQLAAALEGSMAPGPSGSGHSNEDRQSGWQYSAGRGW